MALLLESTPAFTYYDSDQFNSVFNIMSYMYQLVLRDVSNETRSIK